MAALTALQYAMYFRISEHRELAEDTRRLARSMLIEMHYLPAQREAVALLNADGHDADVTGVCATNWKEAYGLTILVAGSVALVFRRTMTKSHK